MQSVVVVLSSGTAYAGQDPGGGRLSRPVAGPLSPAGTPAGFYQKVAIISHLSWFAVPMSPSNFQTYLVGSGV